MAEIIEITDLNDPRLAVYTRLTEAQLRSKRRPEEAMFIAESLKVISHALAAGFQPVSLLMERKHINGQAAELLRSPALAGNIPVYTGPSELLEQLTGYRLTRGILCAMRRPEAKTAEDVCRSASRIAVLEGIVDPTNVGAIFRGAAALGFDGILLSPTCCDPLTRRAVRVSMGTVFQIPWARIGESVNQWPAQGMEQLKSWGFRTAAMALDDRAVSIEDPALAAEERLAVILGTEGDGLLPETIAACDYTVMIPMANGVDSLNVAAAAAVAFWQLRKR